MPPPGTPEEPRAPGLPRGQAPPPEESAPFPLWSSVAWRSRGGARACDGSVLERRSGQGNSVAKVGGGAADGGGRRAARGSAGGERWALLLGSPSCSAQTSSSLLPLPTLSQSSCAASFGKPPLVSLTEAALLLRPVALTSAEMRVFVGSYVSPRPHSHSHTHTRL